MSTSPLLTTTSFLISVDPLQPGPSSAWHVCLPSWYDQGCSRCSPRHPVLWSLQGAPCSGPHGQQGPVTRAGEDREEETGEGVGGAGGGERRVEREG